MRNDIKHSLLADPLIKVQYTDGTREKANLPEIFCNLLQDRIVSFEALQPHQQQPWFSFLVQLAAMAVARENNNEIPGEAAKWKKLLLNLADGSEAAWHLVVDDVSSPAFMQSPVPEGSLEEAGYKADIETPDELDMLVTSKNHDVKGHRILHPAPEHWLFALLTLQTMEGFLGRGNYGIIRMNGGFGNRPFVGISEQLSWGGRFKRDLHVLLNNRPDLLDIYGVNRYTLLWLPDWNGAKSSGIPITECDPFFMEICRRIRFTQTENQIICYRTNTKASRISAPDDLNGRTADPWIPIERKGAKALTLGKSGFTYELLQQLLLGEEYTTPIALEFQQDESSLAFMICQALVRGQGKTDGLHRRIIPIPPRITNRLFRNPSIKEQIAKRSKERISSAEDVQSKILRPALSALLSNGTDQQVDYEKVAPWINRFDQVIDERFFESLWASIEMDSDKAKEQWEKVLLKESERQFSQAERSTPIAQFRRLRAISKARSVFYGQVNKVFEFAGHQQTVSTN